VNPWVCEVELCFAMPRNSEQRGAPKKIVNFALLDQTALCGASGNRELCFARQCGA
jgi:hypothetical protein